MKFSAVGLLSNCTRNIYVTTPIFYVNSVPHLGHLYSALLADAYARWLRLSQNKTVIMSTGTDEHGYKIQKRAALEKQNPNEYCNVISNKFRNLFDRAKIEYTDFIRTTEPRHADAVHALWTTLDANGFIYKSTYKGWYSVNDECFLNDSEVEERQDASGNRSMVSLESGHTVEMTTESNYLFRLSAFKQQLVKYWSREGAIAPHDYREMLLGHLEQLGDLSVSRDAARVHWGLRVPGDPTQVVYVWLDALANYLTVAGYPNDESRFARTWPADVHVIGKDILRFHAVYWPAFLMAAGLPLPSKLLCHGHWLVDNHKMSKSVGNVVEPHAALDRYTLDGVRYFLLREGVPGSDCNISMDLFGRFINADLANTLGNLYQRCVPFNAARMYPHSHTTTDTNKFDSDPLAAELIGTLDELAAKCGAHYDSFNFYLGIRSVMAALRLANNLVQERKPWNLVKSGDDAQLRSLRQMLFLVYETLRIAAILLQPIVPDLAADLLARLGVPITERRTTNARVDIARQQERPMIHKDAPLFARLK